MSIVSFAIVHSRRWSLVTFFFFFFFFFFKCLKRFPVYTWLSRDCHVTSWPSFLWYNGQLRSANCMWKFHVIQGKIKGVMTSWVEVPPLTGLIHFFSSRLRVKIAVQPKFSLSFSWGKLLHYLPCIIWQILDKLSSFSNLPPINRLCAHCK